MGDKEYVELQESIVNELTDAVNLIDKGDVSEARKKLQSLLDDLTKDIAISKSKELD